MRIGNMRGTEYLQSNKFGKSNCLFLKDTKFWMSKKKVLQRYGKSESTYDGNGRAWV